MLTVILKGTDNCNLRCKYCSVGKKENTTIMPKRNMLDAIKFIGNYCEYIGEKNVSLILHGGEPTLVGVEQYNEAFSYFENEYPEICLEVLMQTNGYYLSNKMIAFLKKWDVGVGVSIDGEECIHNNNRKDVLGKDTYRKIVENIVIMKKHGISVSTLIVVSKELTECDLSYFDEFEKLGVPIKLNPILSVGEATEHDELVLQKGDYAKYIISVFIYLIKSDSNLVVSPIDKILNSMLYDIPVFSCTFQKDCLKKFMAISPKGEIYPCGKFSDINKYMLGTIYDDPDKIANHPTKIDLLSRRDNVCNHCSECKYIDKCHTGCIFESEIYNCEYSLLCEDYKMLFRYFEEEGLCLLKDSLIELRDKLCKSSGMELDVE